MSKVTIIGQGAMARALGVRAVSAGHDVQILARDLTRAEALAADLGGNSTAGVIGSDTPTGAILVLAVPYQSAASIVAGYGSALTGRVVVDISNPFDEAHTGLVTPPESSGAEQIAASAAPGVPVLKAFNTLFAAVLAAGGTSGQPADVLIAGNDATAKATLASFVESLELCPVDVGPLSFAHWLEGVGLLILGQGIARGDFSLSVKVLD